MVPKQWAGSQDKPGGGEGVMRQLMVYKQRKNTFIFIFHSLGLQTVVLKQSEKFRVEMLTTDET